MGEAEDRHLVEIAADCRGLLGPGIELVSLERALDGEVVRFIATLRAGDLTHASVASGGSVHEAHVALRRKLVEDRLGLGFEALVGRT